MQHEFKALNGDTVDIMSWSFGIDVRLSFGLYVRASGRADVGRLRDTLAHGGTFSADRAHMTVEHRNGKITLTGMDLGLGAASPRVVAVFDETELPAMFKVIDDALAHTDEEQAVVDMVMNAPHNPPAKRRWWQRNPDESKNVNPGRWET